KSDAHNWCMLEMWVSDRWCLELRKRRKGNCELISARFVSGSCGLLYLKFGTNQRFDLRPDFRIAFDVHMFFGEDALLPRIAFAAQRRVFVTDRLIAKNFGFFGIFGLNQLSAVEKSIGLKEINGLGDI